MVWTLQKDILQRPKSRRIGIFVAAAALVGIGFLTGSRHSQEPIRSTAIEKGNIATGFLELEQHKYQIESIGEGVGGGIASFGDTIVVLTNDGRVFALEEDQLSLLAMKVPDNGISQLERASKKEKFKGYRFRLEPIRYNDILFYEEAGDRGAVISYTFWDDDNECYGTALAHLPIDPSVRLIESISPSPEDWKIIFRTSPCLAPKRIGLAIAGRRAGGRILFEPGGKIILASGDYEQDGVEGPERLAQATDNDYGKIITVDLKTGASEHIAIGLRNPQGITRGSDGEIWVTDQGPRGGDELDLVVPGKDFGWPEATLGTRYNRLPWPGKGSYGRHDGYDKPAFAWVPSVAASTITTIDGMHPAWDGDLMVGSLRGGALFRVRIENERPLFVEPIPIGGRIRAVHQASDGRLALWGDDFNLTILTVTDSGVGQKFLDIVISQTETTRGRKTELRQAFARCSECHSFDYDTNSQSPPLGAIFNSPIGQGSYRGYSDALATHGGTWSRAALHEYLTSVQGFAPGSAMPTPDIADAETINLMVDVLARLTEYRRTK